MNKVTYRRVAIVVAIGLFCAGEAFSVPPTTPSTYTLKFQTVGNKISGTFSPDADVAATEFIDVKYKGPGTDYFITFSAGQSGSFAQRVAGDGSGNTVNYQLYDDAMSRNTLKDLTAALTTSNVLSGTFPYSGSWASHSVSYAFVIQTGQVPVAGTYTDTVTVNLYSGSFSAYTLEDTASVEFKITVDPVINVSLVSANGSFDPTSTAKTLDFGTLAQGQSQQADLLVESNARYSIGLTSTNGALLIQDPTDTSTVPYTITFGGNAVTLPAGTLVKVVTGGTATPVGGDRYPIVVTIGDVGVASPGTYQDTIAITVTSP